MKRCLVCNDPSDSRFCPTCTDLQFADVIHGFCVHAISTSPLDMAQEIMSPPKFPIAGQAHHPLVAAVLVTAWRNAALEEASGRVEARYYPAGSRAAHQPRLTVIEEVA